MASVTKDKDEKAMATDVIAPGAGSNSGGGDDKPRGPAPVRTPDGPGFFTIYKKGQGYWTRMGTAVGAGLLGVLTAYHLYIYLPPLLEMDPAAESRIAVAVAGIFLALYAFFIWRLINKPSNVDFLIATDGEMKKVNWTSRRELIGSTKVVIAFMFLIAILLFVIDIVFSYLMYLIGVLEAGGTTIGGG